MRRSLLEGQYEGAAACRNIGHVPKTALKHLEPAASIADNILGLQLRADNSSADQPRTEKSVDDRARAHTTGLDSYLGVQRVTFGEAPVIRFLQQRKEYTTVRAILSGLLAGVSPGAIRQSCPHCG